MAEPTTHSILRAPFDPSDPMDAMSEMFRREVTDLALQAYKIAFYRDLNTEQQFQCFLAGTLTGIVGVCLASVSTASADAVMEAIADFLPSCREMTEGIMGNDGSAVKNHHDLEGVSGT